MEGIVCGIPANGQKQLEQLAARYQQALSLRKDTAPACGIAFDGSWGISMKSGYDLSAVVAG